MHRLAPAPLKRYLYRNVRDAMTRRFAAEAAAMPHVQIDERRLRNARLLPTRQDLLRRLPRGGTVAEIGVASGGFSADILAIARPARLILADAWHSERYGEAMRRGVEARFAAEIAAGRVEIRRGLSTEVCPGLEDASLDWAYLDTDHSYATTRAELEILAAKVKPGGVIAGHDYSLGSWHGLIRYGVVEAVHEFCMERDWEILFLTMEQSVLPSFAIRAMGGEPPET